MDNSRSRSGLHHAGRICLRGIGNDQDQEQYKCGDQESHRPWCFRLLFLDCGIRSDVRLIHERNFRNRRFPPAVYRVNVGCCIFPFPVYVLQHFGHHRFRCCCREDEIFFIHYRNTDVLCPDLSRFGSLDMGRRSHR